MPLLSLLVLVPMALVVITAFIPAQASKAVFRLITVSGTTLTMAIATALFFQVGPFSGGLVAQGYTYSEIRPWFHLPVPGFGGFEVQWALGWDGLSGPLVWLSSLVLFIASLVGEIIGKRQKMYAMLFLTLTFAVYGTFLALDMVLFYLFFEFMLIPMYLLIGIYGGEMREAAALKFFIYTFAGSLLILIGMIALSLNFNAGSYYTFNIINWTELSAQKFVGPLFKEQGAIFLGLSLPSLIFWCLMIGFFVKMPVVPFHTWLPEAHTEAPSPVSAVLAGILLKIGSYGIMRFVYPIMPEQAKEFAFVIGVIACISIVYGALNALAQTNIKRMVAYSSISHMGFVLLGIATLTKEGYTGAVYQMFSHGFISAFLFLMVGVLYERSHTYTIGHYKGILAAMPGYSSLFIVGVFAAIGLPGFSSFIAELMVIMGTYHSETVNELIPTYFIIAPILGILIGSGYYLWAFQRMFFGKPWLYEQANPEKVMIDLSPREWIILSPLAICALVFGIFPSIGIEKIAERLEHLKILAFLY